MTIPDSITQIGDAAFVYCTNLKSINIPDSVTSVGIYAFSDCRAEITYRGKTYLPQDVTDENDITYPDYPDLYDAINNG